VKARFEAKSRRSSFIIASDAQADALTERFLYRRIRFNR
jgi:hypothetical protein